MNYPNWFEDIDIYTFKKYNMELARLVGTNFTAAVLSEIIDTDEEWINVIEKWTVAVPNTKLVFPLLTYRVDVAELLKTN